MVEIIIPVVVPLNVPEETAAGLAEGDDDVVVGEDDDLARSSFWEIRM